MGRPNQVRAPAPYELLEHTADIAFRVEGRDLPELFARAALALHDVIADTAAARPALERPLAAEGEDAEDALVRLLEEAHFAFEGERLLFAEIADLEVDPGPPVRVRALARGERFDPARHELRRPVKGVTYHDLAIERTRSGGFAARVVLDL